MTILLVLLSFVGGCAAGMCVWIVADEVRDYRRKRRDRACSDAFEREFQRLKAECPLLREEDVLRAIAMGLTREQIQDMNRGFEFYREYVAPNARVIH